MKELLKSFKSLFEAIRENKEVLITINTRSERHYEGMVDIDKDEIQFKINLQDIS